MRLFLSILVTALLVPLTAYAQAAPKQVEVVNPVLAVEVRQPGTPRAPRTIPARRIYDHGIRELRSRPRSPLAVRHDCGLSSRGRSVVAHVPS